MVKQFFDNTRKPDGFGGKLMLWFMNKGHSAMAQTGLSHLVIGREDIVLDIGCGGGMNIRRMARLAGKVCGIDYSPLSVETSRQLNQREMENGLVEIWEASVSRIPYPDGAFTIATAFETVYFWPDFEHDVREVARVLRPGGAFLICNEVTRQEGAAAASPFVKMLDLKVYAESEFQALLAQAGFADVQVYHSKKPETICVLAKRAA